MPLGTMEIVLIVLVVLLLFGGRKLPELARGTGKALRIFKTEVHEDKNELPEQRTAAPQSDDEPVEGEIVDEPRRDTNPQ